MKAYVTLRTAISLAFLFIVCAGAIAEGHTPGDLDAWAAPLRGRLLVHYPSNERHLRALDLSVFSYEWSYRGDTAEVQIRHDVVEGEQGTESRLIYDLEYDVADIGQGGGQAQSIHSPRRSSSPGLPDLWGRNFDRVVYNPFGLLNEILDLTLLIRDDVGSVQFHPIHRGTRPGRIGRSDATVHTFRMEATDGSASYEWELADLGPIALFSSWQFRDPQGELYTFRLTDIAPR